MEIRAELKGFDRAMALFDSRKVMAAGSHAINDVSSRVRTAADRQVRSKFALKAGLTKKHIRVTARSRRSTLQAIVSAQSQPLSLRHFPTRQVTDRSGGVAVRAGGRKFDEYRKNSRAQRGLSAKITKQGGYKRIDRGFAIRHSRGGLSYWRRTGPGKWGTMEGARLLRVITVASMFEQAHVAKEINQTIDKHWSRRFSYRLDRELAKN